MLSERISGPMSFFSSREDAFGKRTKTSFCLGQWRAVRFNGTLFVPLVRPGVMEDLHSLILHLGRCL